MAAYDPNIRPVKQAATIIHVNAHMGIKRLFEMVYN